MVRRWAVVLLTSAIALLLPSAAGARPPGAVQLPFVTDHVAVYWHGQPHARVRVAFSRDGVTFSRSVDAGRDDLGEQVGDGITYGAVLRSPHATAVRLLSDRRVNGVTVVALPDRPVRRLLGRIKNQTNPGTAHTPRPTIISRADWGANESLRFSNGTETWPPAFAATHKLIVHHTDTPNNDPNPASTVRAIYYYHAITQGWGDIGYNFLIDEAGHIYKGRNSHAPGSDADTITGQDANGNGVTGAHARNYNSGSVGVALLGTLTNQDATPAAKNALEDLLAWEASVHHIDPHGSTSYPNVAGHRDVGTTQCPGGAFYATLPQVRDAVAARTY